MKSLLLTLEVYQDFFNNIHQEALCGIAVENNTNEKYLLIQSYLPKTFLNFDFNFLQNPAYRSLISQLPEKILFNFELFASGYANDRECFVFKPWALNINNINLCQVIENFHLYLLDTIFYEIINKEVFIEKISIKELRTVRVLNYINSSSYSNSGLPRYDGDISFEIDDISVVYDTSVEKEEIISFYRRNGFEIGLFTEQYFNKLHNSWLEIYLTESTETIGYIRLYDKPNTFPAYPFIEFIIDKRYRNRGIATKAVLDTVEHLKVFSYASCLQAIVNEDDFISKSILQSSGFREISSDNPYGANFSISLTDAILDIEKDFEKGVARISIEEIFASYYKRYS